MKAPKKVTPQAKATKAKSVSPAAAAVAETSVSEGLTRPAAAEFLGINESKLRRLESSGALPPSFNAKGHHVHTLDQLRKYKMQERAKQLPSSPEFDGHAAAAAFELFDRGFGPADAVKEAVLASRVARDLYREWASLRNMFVVEGEVRQKLEELANYTCNGEEINNSDDLMRAIDVISGSLCRCCASGGPWFCARCVFNQPDHVKGIAFEGMLAEQTLERERQKRVIARAEARRARLAAMSASERARKQGGGAAEGHHQPQEASREPATDVHEVVAGKSGSASSDGGAES